MRFLSHSVFDCTGERQSRKKAGLFASLEWYYNVELSLAGGYSPAHFTNISRKVVQSDVP